MIARALTGACAIDFGMDRDLPIEISPEEIAAFCQRHGIARLSLFGSVLREDFTPESDVDVLVEFLPDARPTLFTLAGLQADLTDMLGRQVDLRTPLDLSERFRAEVLAASRTLHAA